MIEKKCQQFSLHLSKAGQDRELSPGLHLSLSLLFPLSLGGPLTQARKWMWVSVCLYLRLPMPRKIQFVSQRRTRRFSFIGFFGRSGSNSNSLPAIF